MMKPSEMPWKLSQSKTLNGYTFCIESADGYTIGEFYGSTNPMWDSVPGARQGLENAKFVVDSSELIAELEKKLSASQLQNTQLRESLALLSDAVGRFVSDEGWRQSDMDNMDAADCMLAIPTDTTALESLIAKAGEVMRERCAKETDALRSMYRSQAVGAYDGTYDFKQIAAEEIIDEIRAIHGVTLEDLK